MKEVAGTWRITEYYFETPDGNRSFPWGERPTGWFILDEQGNMSAQIMHESRPDMDQPPSKDQTAHAYHSYVAYFGQSEVDQEAGTITTRVQGALNPAWVGGDQIREFSFDGNRLMLRTPWMELGKIKIRGTIFWERLEPGAA